MGLRKFAPYRKDGSNWDKNRAARLKELKTTLQERRVALGASDDISKELPEKPAKKRKGKKERMKAKATAGPDLVEVNVDESGSEEPTLPESKKRKTNPDPGELLTTADEIDVSVVPLKAKRRRHKKSGKSSANP